MVFLRQSCTALRLSGTVLRQSCTMLLMLQLFLLHPPRHILFLLPAAPGFFILSAFFLFFLPTHHLCHLSALALFLVPAPLVGLLCPRLAGTLFYLGDTLFCLSCTLVCQSRAVCPLGQKCTKASNLTFPGQGLLSVLRVARRWRGRLGAGHPIPCSVEHRRLPIADGSQIRLLLVFLGHRRGMLSLPHSCIIHCGRELCRGHSNGLKPRSLRKPAADFLLRAEL